MMMIKFIDYLSCFARTDLNISRQFLACEFPAHFIDSFICFFIASTHFGRLNECLCCLCVAMCVCVVVIRGEISFLYWKLYICFLSYFIPISLSAHLENNTFQSNETNCAQLYIGTDAKSNQTFQRIDKSVLSLSFSFSISLARQNVIICKIIKQILRLYRSMFNSKSLNILGIFMGKMNVNVAKVPCNNAIESVRSIDSYFKCIFELIWSTIKFYFFPGPFK